MPATLESLRSGMAPLPDGRWLLGLSGGADSVALMYLLLPRVREGRLHLTAVHVHHGIRGASADEDAEFCRSVCLQEGIPFRMCRVSLAGRTDEDAAREARYACFRETAEELGAEGILLAHHLDDLAETCLMRLLRGAGPEGLGCMTADGRAMGIRVIRPLLRIHREELREALRTEGVCWREDESNRDQSYLRNAIRGRLLPEMEALIPGAAGRIARTAELIGAENRWIESEAEEWLRRLSGGRWIDGTGLGGLDQALQARVLRLWWKREGPDRKERALSADQTEALISLVRTDRGQVNLPGGLHAVRGKRYLHLTGFPAGPVTEVSWQSPESTLGAYTLRMIPQADGPGDGKREQAVPAGFLEGCVLRTRRPGDRIRPFGFSGTRKLQDYLTDRGVEAPWRDQIPLLCRGSEVLLAGGVGAGHVPLWENNQDWIRLTWTGPMPWEESERK